MTKLSNWPFRIKRPKITKQSLLIINYDIKYRMGKDNEEEADS